MEIIIKVGQFLFSISLLVILHELGHFLFARLFKTRVEKFYLFFNPWFSLFKVKKGDTEYGVGWLPLGGYVKISGMIDESMDKEQMKKPPQPYEFRSKKTYERLLIMLGGVLVNFITALVIFIFVLYTWGEKYLPTKNVKYGIVCDSIALDFGLKNGDKILTVDDKYIDNFHSIAGEIILSDAKTIMVDRNGSKVQIDIPDDFISKLIKTRKAGFISPRFPFIVGEFSKESVAKTAGFRVMDTIIGINDSTVLFFDEFKSLLSNYKNKNIEVKVLRGGEEVTIPVKVPESGILGILGWGTIEDYFELKHISYGFFESIPAGISKGFNTISDYWKQLKLLVKPKTKAYESLGGFITIGNIFPGYWDWQSFWSLTAFLSIILAIMNILPIPALDGGHVLFLVYEIVTGRKPSDKFLEIAQIVGMIIIFSLLLYANGNDIVRLFNK